MIRPYRVDGPACCIFRRLNPQDEWPEQPFSKECESNAELGHRQNRSARWRPSVVYVPVQFLERAEDFCCICPGDWRYLCPNGPEGGLKGWSGFISEASQFGGPGFSVRSSERQRVTGR